MYSNPTIERGSFEIQPIILTEMTKPTVLSCSSKVNAVRFSLFAIVGFLSILVFFQENVIHPKLESLAFSESMNTVLAPPLLAFDYSRDIKNEVPLLHECLTDWKDWGFDGTVKLPPIVPEGIEIPFYVYPDPLPKTMSWSECYLHTNNPMYAKRQWSYYLAKQLEIHPWRVYSPEDALLYVIPYLDSNVPKGDRPEVHEDCSKLLLTPNEALEDIDRFVNEVDYITDHNLVAFLGYYNQRSAWSRWREGEEKSGRDLWWMQRIHAATFTPCPIRRIHHPNQLHMSGGVDEGLCFPTDIETLNSFKTVDDRLSYCHNLHETLEADATLPYEEWKKVRFIQYESMGRYDDREMYWNRKLMTFSLMSTLDDDLLPASLSPSVILYKEQFAEDHTTEKTKRSGEKGKLVDCRSQVEKLVATNNINPDTNAICGGNQPREWKSEIPEYPEIDWDIKRRSRMTLSLRGDSLGSQRSLEGMMFGTLTWHDNSAAMLGLAVLPLPDRIPWRLTGAFDENYCLKNLRKQYRTEFSNFIQIKEGEWVARSYESEEDKAKYKLTQEEMDKKRIKAKELELAIAQCLTNLSDLIELRPDVVDLMRSVINYYRDDVLFETPQSRVGQALLFEAASNMPADELLRFNLTPNDFKRLVPRTCTANVHRDIRKVQSLSTEKERKAYLESLGDWEDITSKIGQGHLGGK